MVDSFLIVEGDMLPRLVVFLRNSDGTPMDLSGTDVKFYMRSENKADIRIDGSPVEILDVQGGKVRYSWIPANTEIPGTYHAQFKVFQSDKAMTVPTEEPLVITVVPKQA